MTDTTVELEVTPEEAGLRLDVLVARRPLGLTRSQAERLAREGKITVAGRPGRAGQRVEAGDRVVVAVPERPREPVPPEPIPLEVLFEDEHVVVLNKPQGLVVHPGVGRNTGTLANALVAHIPGLRVGLPHRPGIVHRLDRDTSGLMVVAKTEPAFEDLSRQVRQREVDRRYLALVWGEIREDQLVIAVPLGRHRRYRTRMAAVPFSQPERLAKEAYTEVEVRERLGRASLVEARLLTGRTHQIRVHLSHVGHPVVGDRVYGRGRARQEEAALDAETQALVAALPGQALHAHSLRFRHPVTGQEMSFAVPMPQAMGALVARLRRLGQGQV